MARPGRRHGKYRQATRLLRLLDHLRSIHFGATLEELAEELGVTGRQVRRDLEALDEAGYSIESMATPDGRARIKLPPSSGRSVTLTMKERYGLLAARRLFDVLGDTPLHEEVQSLFAKVAASLSDDKRKSAGELAERFRFVPDGGAMAYRGKADVLEGLLSGVILRVRVRCRYRAPSGETGRGLFEPFAMVLFRQELHLIGRMSYDGVTPGEGEPQVFAAERFSEAEEVRGDRFEVPADFQLDAFFHGAFGLWRGRKTERVVIEFSPQAQRQVEARQWHQSQRMVKVKGGGVRLTFDLGDLTEVVPWVLAWGEAAVVREPKRLALEVAEALRSAAAHYPSSAAKTPRKA